MRFGLWNHHRQPLNIQTLIDAQGLHIAVLEAQIAGCQALRFTLENRRSHRRPRRPATQDIGRPRMSRRPDSPIHLGSTSLRAECKGHAGSSARRNPTDSRPFRVRWSVASYLIDGTKRAERCKPTGDGQTMSMLELIREGFGDEPDVEAFVQKYEMWEALVLNLRSQLDQTESLLNDQGVGPEDPLLRTRLAEDERVYREELRQLRRLVLTAILYPVRGEAATLAGNLEEAMHMVELDPASPTAEAVEIVDVDLVGLAAAVTRWKHSRN